ncbi:MAG: hypothetical protein BMS9Abin06_0645 [Gammaproteobacteria bacterium]|nr:MAG: hypothetical protein BMS9Abin06_0645 [Gammaproteobacteria bacterium]
MQDDITARHKQIKHALRENQGLFRHLVESAHAIPWEIDPSTWRFTYVGPQAVTLFGYPLDAWYEQDFWIEHLHPDDRETALSSCQAVTERGENHEFEYRMFAADGRVVWIRDSVNVVKGDTGPVTLQGYMFDITAYKQTLEALTHSEAQFAAMFNAIPDAVTLADTERRIVMNNPALHDMFGYSDEELIGNTTEMLYADPADYKKQGQHRYRVGPGTEQSPYEVRYRRKDGTVFWTETLGTQVKDASGTVIGFIGMIRDISERKTTEAVLEEKEARIRMIFESALDAVIVINDKSVINEWNPQAEATFGWEKSEVIGRTLMETIIPSRFREAHLHGMETLLTTDDGPILNRRMELTALHREGNEFPVELTVSPLRYEENWIFSAFVRDLTEGKRAEDLRSRFGRILDNSSNEIYIFDAESMRFSLVNRGGRHNLGYSMQELEKLTPLDLKPDHTLESFAELLQPLRRGDQEQVVFQTRHRRKDGSLYPVEVHLQLSHEESPPVFFAIIQDITERIQAEEQLQYLAHHDALTTLPNRVLFTDRLEQSLARAHWHDRAVAVLFLDLDRFKVINDTLGHDVGDRALQALSERLNGCVREGDTVARLGGDEFAIVLEDVAMANDVAPTARKMLDILSQPFQLDEHEFILTTSIGISLFPIDGKDTQTLLKHADIAMYRAKEQGRNTYQFYSADMSAKAFERMSLETNLRHALERDEFVLYYQPQQNLADGRIFGVEALLRWQHPDLGLVGPVEFIPLLEETGLIIPVGEWVLHTACLQARAWADSGLKPLRLSVNLSGRQTNNSNFIATVEQVLKDSKLDPALLELEMTESILMHNMQTTITTLETVSKMGVRLAIDDFGTGYSSLSYLKRFPIDTLKIDRSFIHDLTQDPDDATLVEAIIVMGRALNLNVIAEGVETEAQVEFLRTHHCDSIQGFLISKPKPAQELTTLLHEKLVVTGK